MSVGELSCLIFAQTSDFFHNSIYERKVAKDTFARIDVCTNCFAQIADPFAAADRCQEVCTDVSEEI